jgi:hypothetical protein
MKKFAMKVNPANLVKGLKYSFTNKTTVLGELMQNSRRANATQVVFEFYPDTNILKVTDDGDGIDSIETLLTIAESGWDTDVVAQEHPFGLGFLSALFSCSHLTVVSKSGRISSPTADILSFKPVTIAPVTDWDGTTSITMMGVNVELSDINETLCRLARGFPIPVSLNGVIFDRPHAFDADYQFVHTEIGEVYLSINKASSSFDIYLQGLPIYSTYYYGKCNRHVIHLDSARFYARLPDRDKLIDETEVVNIVTAVLKKQIKNYLVERKASISAKEFVAFYRLMQEWHLLDLLNDVNAVPVEVLSSFNGYPTCNTEAFGDFTQALDAPLTRVEIEAREVVELDECIDDDGAAYHMFARERDALIYDGGLDHNHWLHALIRRLANEELTVEMVNETHTAAFQGDWVSVAVHFCESYLIKIGGDVVEITGDALYQGYDEGTVIVPKWDQSGMVLCQVSTYRTEHDDFQESTHDSDMDAFQSFVVANTSSDPADALTRLIPSSFNCPSLNGGSFLITINGAGGVASVMAA